MALYDGPNLGLLVDGTAGDEHYARLMKQWRGLDALVMPRVMDRDLTAPPGFNVDGDCYIVATGAAGAWGSHAGHIARFSGIAGWEFYVPKEGWRVYVIDEQAFVTWNSTAWVRADASVVTLTDASTIAVNAALSGNFRVTLAANRTLGNPTNLVSGMVFNIRIKQDATGGRTLSYGSKYKFPGGTAPLLSTAANAIDFMSCQYDGTDDTIFAVLNKAFA